METVNKYAKIAMKWVIGLASLPFTITAAFWWFVGEMMILKLRENSFSFGDRFFIWWSEKNYYPKFIVLFFFYLLKDE